MKAKRPVSARQKKPARRKQERPRPAAPKLQVPDSCRVIGRFVVPFYDY